MSNKKCKICLKPTSGKICKKCTKIYIYVPKLCGFRLKKRGIPSGYAWKSELRVYRILRRMFKVVHRNFRPLFAEGPKGALLEYDICIPSKKILIEVDGAYHYDRALYTKPIDFEYRRLCDSLKEMLAQENGWTFRRIDITQNLITPAGIRRLIGIRDKIKFLRRGV